VVLVQRHKQARYSLRNVEIVTLVATDGCNVGESTRTKKGRLAGTGKNDARLNRVVRLKKGGGGNPLI